MSRLLVLITFAVILSSFVIPIKAEAKRLPYGRALLFYLSVHDYAGAEKMIQTAVADLKENHPNSKELPMCLNDLGTVYKADGKLAQAETAFNDALSLEGKTIDVVPSLTIEISANLADLYFMEGKFLLAEQLYTRVLASTEDLKAKPASYHLLAEYNLDLFKVYDAEDKVVEQKPLLDEVVRMRKEENSKDKSKLGEAKFLLGQWYLKQKNLPAAKQEFQDVIDLDSATADKLVVSLNMIGLAEVLALSNERSAALKLADQARSTMDHYSNMDYETQAVCMTDLGNLYLLLDDYKEAEKVFNRCLKLTSKTYGASNIRIAMCFNNLIDAYVREGAFERALPLCRKGWEVLRHYKEGFNRERSIFAGRYKTVLKQLNLNSELDEIEKAE